ncbi:MAG: alpha/beta hydrolase [Dehalococcoidales bacterium]|nr:alpha/beta hydrolase [Dehalococcoidales bacterium]
MNYINIGKENSGNIDIYYEDHGTGKPVVLIHGWPLSGDSWEKQVTVLLDAGYRVISYDRRGFGNSSKPTSGYDYDTFAEDLDKLMMKLDLHNAMLVGFSMGGGEVARYLGKYGSKRVERAVFLYSVPPFLLKTPDNPSGVDKSVFDGIMKAIAADRLAFLSKFLSDFYNVDVLAGKRVSDQVVQFSWNVAAGASPKGTLDCVQAWLTDFRKDLTHIGVPTLIIHGDADRILPIDATGRRLHETIKGSRYIEIKDGPHGIIWTHSEEVNRELLAFSGV